MSTASQFIAKPAIKPITIISGKNKELRGYCGRFILNQIKPTSLVSFQAKSQSWSDLANSIADVNPFDLRPVFWVDGIQNWKDETLDTLHHYATSHISGTYLVLTANDTKRKNKQRWIPNKPALKSVQYIDCGNLDDAALTNFVSKAARLNTNYADKLIDSAGADMASIIRLVDMVNYSTPLGKRPTVEIIESLLSTPVQYSPLLEYGIPAVPDDGHALFNLLKRQFDNLLRLSIAIHSGIRDTKVLARNTRLEVFQVSRWRRLAEKEVPAVWLRRINLLLRSEPHISNPHFKGYMELLLTPA